MASTVATHHIDPLLFRFRSIFHSIHIHTTTQLATSRRRTTATEHLKSEIAFFFLTLPNGVHQQNQRTAPLLSTNFPSCGIVVGIKRRNCRQSPTKATTAAWSRVIFWRWKMKPHESQYVSVYGAGDNGDETQRYIRSPVSAYCYYGVDNSVCRSGESVCGTDTRNKIHYIPFLGSCIVCMPRVHERSEKEKKNILRFGL